MTELEKFFYKKARMVACKYYKSYERIYKIDTISRSDLIQEAYITALEVLRNEKYKDKPKEELIRILNQALRYKLNGMRNVIVRRRTIFIQLGWQEILKHFAVNLEGIGYEETFFKDFTTDIEANLLCQQASSFLTEEEFNVMYKTVVEGKSFRETAEDLNLSHPTVSKIDKTVKEKIRKFNENRKQ